MWILVLMIAAWLFFGWTETRNRLGHYPSDEIALVQWRMVRGLKHWLLMGAMLWILFAFSKFVFDGGFLVWLLAQ